MMAVDISIYRARTGLFGPGTGFKGSLVNTCYSPYTTGTDIHWRMLLTCMVLSSTFFISALVTKSLLSLATVSDLDIFIRCYTSTVNVLHNASCETSWSGSIYSSYKTRLLLLSSDVELNPGPISEKDQILNAVYETRDSLKSEIHYIQEDVGQIKIELNSVRKMCEDVKHKTDKLCYEQSVLSNRLENTEAELKCIQHENEMLQFRCRWHERYN